MANTRKQKVTKKEKSVLQKSMKKKPTKKIISPTKSLAKTTSPAKSLSSLVHEPSWSKNLQDLFQSDNFKRIEEFLNNQWSTGKITYPPKDLIFEAFNKTPFDQVKVVLLGQDPYHDDGQVQTKKFFSKKNFFMMFLGPWISFFSPENNDNFTSIFKKYFQRISQ
jgi:uracil-DNA glycosylase